MALVLTTGRNRNSKLITFNLLTIEEEEEVRKIPPLASTRDVPSRLTGASATKEQAEVIGNGKSPERR